MKKSISDLPSAQNRQYPFIVLVDIFPDAGDLYGFFNFSHKGRRISGKLFADLKSVIAFLKGSQDILASTLGEDGLATAKVRVCVVDRMGEGAMITPLNLRSYAQYMYYQAFMDKRKANLSGEVVEREAQEARRQAGRLIGSISWKLRASSALLNNEDAISVLDRHIGRGWKISYAHTDNVLPYVVSLFKDYIADTSIPSALRESVYRVDSLLRESITRVVAGLREQKVAEFERRVGPGNFPFRIVGYQQVLDIVERKMRFNLTRTLLLRVLLNRINFLDPAVLDAAVRTWLAESFSDASVTQSLFSSGDHYDPTDLRDPSNYPREIRQTTIDVNDGLFPVSMYSPKADGPIAPFGF